MAKHITRPAVSEPQLSLTPNGNVRSQLKTPYRDGTTRVIYEPLDFITRLAALVPRPKVNLTLYHDVFSPNTHQGKMCCGRTPIETLIDGKQIWKEKFVN